ncbi:hypothetical protein BJP37_11055 [Moorena bouillonii PNG]|uniref:Uncharacterized protein n=1 Tax=Moorena bouillonii PNG TaxID=568701 RepID=A0A1U7N0K2_9CYAN|nr:hypothetical protein BJP37_11055 [Moorena bouillonii PNG]
MQSLMGETPKTALHRLSIRALHQPSRNARNNYQFLMQSLMGETTAVAHGGNPHMKALPPQDRAASLFMFQFYS